jgi:hypothetical protein
MFKGIIAAIANVFATKTSPAETLPPPPSPETPRRMKRQSQLANMEYARECKRLKKEEAQKVDNMNALFWDGVDDAVDRSCEAELCLMAMKRLDDGWTFKAVNDATGVYYRKLKEQHELWISENKSEERFKYHVAHKKRGIQVYAPLALLDMQDLNKKIVRNEDCQLLATRRSAYEHVVLPVLKEEAIKTGKNALTLQNHKSKSSIQRIISKVLPKQRKGGGAKKSVKNRLAARQSPFGAMSFVAMYPQLVEGVNLMMQFFIDSVPCVLFDPSKQQERVYMTEEVYADLANRRAAPKSKDAGGQKRAMKVNINMAPGPDALVGGVGMIFDHVIKEIVVISLTATVDVIFAPYCAKDEEALLSQQQEQERDSLDARVNHVLYEKCIIPKILMRIERYKQWARENNLNPEIYSTARAFQDSEGGPLFNILQYFAERYKHLGLWFAKLPNALTGEVQIGDRSGAHPLVHKGFNSDEFKSMTEETVVQIAESLPGIAKALKFLKNSGISAAGQTTYRRAIAFLPQLLERSVTPAVVTDALKNSGYHPFSPSIMMNNMWDGFTDLSTSEAEEVIRISREEIANITKEQGIVYPRQCQDALENSVILRATIEFPEIRENFEDLAWNRHLTMDLSHTHVHNLVLQRAQASAEAAAVARQRTISQAEIKRRENVRFDHCTASQHTNEKRTICHVCKCGGKWSNGMTGFKAHETTSQTHLHHFPPDTYWAALYDVVPPPQIALNGAASNLHVAANAAAPSLEPAVALLAPSHSAPHQGGATAAPARARPVGVGLLLPAGFEAILEQNE